MKAVKSLGPEYVYTAGLDMSNRRVVLGLNLVGLGLLFAFGWLFLQAAAAVRPENLASGLSVFNSSDFLALLASLLVILILHELVHGLFFRIYTGERPKFGVHVFYAYAAAPDWYLPRNQFIVTGVAPLVLLTLLGLLLLPIVPMSFVPILLLALIVNAAGSVGDLFVIGWLLTYPSTLMAQDTGPKIALYKPTADMLAALNKRWLKLLETYDVERDTAGEAFADLVDHYSEGDRYYHNLEHVGYVLDMLARLRSLAHDYPAVQLAAWYHDVIYDPRASDNEAKSAAYARRALERLGVARPTIDKVSDIIMATISHQPTDDADIRVMLDADLSALGADETDFRNQSDAIRREYDYVPDEEYAPERVRRLTLFLDRERIFQTEELYESLEARARRNIETEIASLS